MPRAIDDWIELARLVVGCITADRLLIRRSDGIEPTVAFFATPAGLRISGALAGSRLGVRVSLDGRAERSMNRLDIIGYDYVLEDRRGVELLAFHLHLPDARGHHPRPHVHVSAALRPHQPNGDRGLVPLDKRHLPTGRVTLGDVVAMLIEEFGAEPRVGDWRGRLAAAGAPFA